MATIADLRLNHEVILQGSYLSDTPRGGVLTSQNDATRTPWLLPPADQSGVYPNVYKELDQFVLGSKGLYDQLEVLVDLTKVDKPDAQLIAAQNAQIEKLAENANQVYSSSAPQIVRSFDETDRVRTQLVLAVGIALVALMILVLSIFNAASQRRRLLWSDSHDSLTGWGNRDRFAKLATAVLKSRDSNGVMALIMIDIDGFAELNRAHGSAQCDALLQTVADRLGEQLRSTDIAARIAGDVFVVGCRRIDDPLVARSLAQRMSLLLAEPIRLNRETEIRLSATFGIELMRAREHTLDQALDHCRLAVHAGKKVGRGEIELFSQSLKDSETAELQLHDELRRAIDFGELVVFYQPEVDLATGMLLGSEALVRWVHPQHGLLQPGVFIPLAEKSGLIVDLGAYVLIEACRQAGEWARDYPQLPMKMRVNLSTRQLESFAIVDLVSQALDISGLEASSLCLEITESALMEDAENARRLLERLAGLGVRLAIDDFGTGYSSLAYLEKFPVDVLKIDRSFIDGLDVDDAKSAIVAAVVGLAKALGLHVTAEGVETESQRQALVDLGCKTGQGYYFARPEPAHRIQQIIDAQAGTTPRLPAQLDGSPDESSGAIVPVRAPAPSVLESTHSLEPAPRQQQSVVAASDSIDQQTNVSETPVESSIENATDRPAAQRTTTIESQLHLAPEPQSESEPEPQSESEPDTETESEPEPQSESEPDTETESEPEPQSESEPDTATESEPEPQSESEPEPQSESEPEPQSESEPDTETESEPDTETESEQQLSQTDEAKAPGPDPVTTDFVANASRRFGIFSNGAPINFDEVADY